MKEIGEQLKSLEEFKQSGLRGALYELDLSLTQSYSESKKNGRSNKHIPVVLDNAIWAATTELWEEGQPLNKVVVISSDGKNVSEQVRVVKFMVLEIKEIDEEVRLTPFKFLEINTNKKEEVSILMADNVENAQQAAGHLEDIMSQLEKETAGNSTPAANDVTPMDTFSEETPEKKKKEQVAAIPVEISNKLERVKTSNANQLQNFNYSNGLLVNHITSTDRRFDVSISKRLRKVDGKPVLLANGVPKEVRETFDVTKTADRVYLQYDHELKFRDVKPGKGVGAVIGIPVGGIVNLSLFRSGEKLTPDFDKKELKYQVVTRDMLFTMLQFYFGGRIKEDPKTHGPEAGEVFEVAKMVNKVDQGTQQTQQVVHRVLKTTRGRSLFTEGNYFPLTTYKTVKWDARLTDEEVAAINTYLFRPLIDAAPTGNDSQNRFALLREADRENIHFDAETEATTSVYFTKDANSLMLPEVTPFWAGAKDEISLDELNIVVKEPKTSTKSGSNKVRWNAVKVNTLNDKELAENPEAKSYASLYSGKFDTVIKAGNDVMTPETLAQFRRGGGGGGRTQRQGLTTDQLMRLQIGTFEGEIDSTEVTMAEGASWKDLENFMDELEMDIKTTA